VASVWTVSRSGLRWLWVVPALAMALAGAASAGGAPAPGAAASGAVTHRGVVTIRTVRVGDPGNAPAGIIPFQPGIYGNCSEVPAGTTGCQLVGGVAYPYEIGELEVTVKQYVTFLNTVDPEGRNVHNVYVNMMSPSRWPKYGSIRRASGRGVAPGAHYSVAYPQWANKPIGFANFLRAARFVNALSNGDILSRTESSAGGFQFVTYVVRLSRET